MNAVTPIATTASGKSFDLNTFTYNGAALRAVVDGEGKPWFAAADVLRCIGLSTKGGTSWATGALGKDEKITARRYSKDGKGSSLALALGPHTSIITMVSESGFYKMVLRAQRSNPAAREFQDWVTKEVLPRISRDGAYIMVEEKVATGGVKIEDFFECTSPLPLVMRGTA